MPRAFTGVRVAELRWIIDTAPLLWFVEGAPRRLGTEARRAIREIEAGRARAGVPTVCLFEVAQLEERGRIRLRRPFEEWCDLVEQAPGLAICPLGRVEVSEARALPTLRDPFDRLIAGTALALGIPLISPDARIAGAGRIRVVW